MLSVSLAILVITAGLFFFLPRTARAAFQHLVSHRYHLAGFSNHVTLGEIGEIKQENSPVMHVKMDRPEDRALALKWRGAALSEFNGRAWFNRPAPGQILRPDRAGLLRLDDESPRRDGRYISYAVYLSELAQDALFFAGTPQYLRIDSLVVRRPFGNYSAQFSDARTVSYQVYSRLDSPARPPGPGAWWSRCQPMLAKPICNCRAWTRAFRELTQEHCRRRSIARRPGPHAGEISAHQLRLHARTSQGRAGRSAGLLPVPSQEGALRILRLLHGGDAARAGNSVARDHRLSKRNLQSHQRLAIDPQLGRAQLGGGLAAASRLDHVRSHAARSERAQRSRPGRGWASTPTPSTSSGRTGF